MMKTDYSSPAFELRVRALAAALLLAGAVSGCSMAPAYQRPAAPVAESFPAVAAAHGAPAPGP
jgi:multidrug efflux system outer membrane protein